jgi:hypothetical protein
MTAPDATDWKARCEAAEGQLSVLALDLSYEIKKLTAAQAENEKLRKALIEAIQFASLDCQALTPLGEAMVARWTAISQLSPEKP